MEDVFAAGGVVWRVVGGVRRVGVVSRARYGGDVSLPKGKLEPGETLRGCAVREVAEELGVSASLGDFLVATTYRADGRDKYVLYWEMNWTGDLPHDADGKEIAGRQWLEPQAALGALTYASDRAVLNAALERLTSRPGG